MEARATGEVGRRQRVEALAESVTHGQGAREQEPLPSLPSHRHPHSIAVHLKHVRHLSASPSEASRGPRAQVALGTLPLLRVLSPNSGSIAFAELDSKCTCRATSLPQGAPHLVSTKRHDLYDAISPTSALKNAADGLSVLVTGSGRGVGRAEALAFAQAGAKKVVLTSRSRTELDETKELIDKETAGGDCEVIVCEADLCDPDSVEKLFEAAGPIDGKSATLTLIAARTRAGLGGISPLSQASL